MPRKKRKSVVVKAGSMEPGARDLARLDAIRKGALKEMIECFDQCSSPAEFNSGVWEWTAHDLFDEPPVPFRALSKMVPDHDFEDLFSHTDYDVDQIGEKHYRDGTTTSGCRALRAMYSSGGHYSGHTGGSLSVYPSARAWDREAKVLMTEQKKADEAEAEEQRAADEERWREENLLMQERMAEWISAHQAMIDRIRTAATAVSRDLASIARHSTYRPSERRGWTRGGYSVELPTQEQVRAAVWARLHDPESMTCELDWNRYEVAGRGLKTIGKIDLAGFAVEGEPDVPILLMDITRAWTLDHRYRSLVEQRAEFTADLRRLRAPLPDVFDRPQSPHLVGVLVFGFASRFEDLGDKITDLYPSLGDRRLNRIELLRDRRPAWRVPIETVDGDVMGEVFMQVDLLVLYREW